VLRLHPWAIPLLESRTSPGPATLGHHDAVLGTRVRRVSRWSWPPTPTPCSTPTCTGSRSRRPRHPLEVAPRQRQRIARV